MALIDPTGSNDLEAFVEGLLSGLSDFYDKESDDTTLKKLYTVLAAILQDADIEISALLHDNFLSVDIIDEVVTRSISSKDRLRKEGAFKIDRIGFTPSTFVRRETHRLEVEQTVVTLDYIPTMYTEVKMYNSDDNNKVPVSIIVDFDETNNTITVAGVGKAGNYVFEYIDTGDVTQTREQIEIPRGLFDLGFGEGGFGHFGFGV